MKLQSDSVLVFDLVKERDKFLARLATAEEKPVIGGWGELFLSTIKVISHEGDESENDGEETVNECEFHGIKLETRTEGEGSIICMLLTHAQSKLSETRFFCL